MDRVAAVVPSVSDVDPAGWLNRFDDMFARVVAPEFFRREPRLRARAYLRGLVAGLERANGWTIAEFAGDRLECPRLPDSPFNRMGVWKGEVIAPTEEELLP